MCQYRTSFRAKKPLIHVGTPVKIDVLKSTTQWRGLKLPPEQMLQRFLILLAQVEAENTSEILLIEIRQIV